MSIETSCEGLCDSPKREATQVVETVASMSRRNMFKAIAAGAAAVGLGGLSATAAKAATKSKVCATSKISVGGGNIFALKSGAYVLITQPKKNVFRAFSPYCTHQQTLLAGINGSNVICSRHGASYNTTTGQATGGPARGPLTVYSTSVSGGYVYVTA